MPFEERETAFSPYSRRDLQKPDLIEVLSAFLRGEAQIVGGFGSYSLL